VPLPICTSEGARMLQFGVTGQGKAMAAKVFGRLVGATLTGRKLFNAGAALQARLLEVALRLGVDIWTDAALQDLDVRDGRVEGAHLLHQGRPVTVQAPRGVVITAGGFARNLAMRDLYQRDPVSDRWTVANPGDTGEAIQAMERAGAGLALMDESWWNMVFLPPDGGAPLQTVPELHKPHGILVDASGQRFVNEAASYMEQGRAAYARNESVPAIPAWLVMDARARRRYFFALKLPGGFPKDWLKKGAIKKDDTLAGLAAQCGIDPEGLAATVARFNRFAKSGVDEDFARGASAYNRYYGDPTVTPNPCLGAIAEPPFWAAPLWPGDVGTCGGAITDEHARVLRKDGSAIDGLYAAGNCTASLAGPHYVGAGQSIGTSSIFGYLAARHAVG
jgi:3-oxosteroid 1-dehydrogenase